MYSNTMSKSFFASTIRWVIHRQPTGKVLSHFNVFLRPSTSKSILSYLSDLDPCPFLTFNPAAFSIPEVNMECNATSESLRCEAPRWFPQPTVVWASQVDQGANFSEVSNTSFELNSENVTMKVVSILYNVTINNTYSCMIENNIAKATGDIKVTGGFLYTFGMGLLGL